MVARFFKTDYPKAYVMGETLPDHSKTTGLKGLAWNYIESITKDELEVNRETLINALKEKV